MPQTIEVPDQGVVEFPDDMSSDQIRGVIQKKFYSDNVPSATPSSTPVAIESAPVVSENQPVPSSVPGPGNQPTPEKDRGLGAVLSTLFDLPGRALLGTTNAVAQSFDPAFVTGQQEQFIPTQEDIHRPAIPPVAAKLLMPYLFAGDAAKTLFPESPVARGFAGATEGIAGSVAGLTSAGNVALAPLAGGGKAAQIALAAAFETQAALQVPAQWKAFSESKDPEEKAKLAAEVLVGLGLPIYGGLHAGFGKTPESAPATLAENLAPIIGDERPMVPIESLPPTEPMEPVVPTEPPVTVPDAAKVGSRIEGPALVDAEGNIIAQGKVGETHKDLLEREMGGPNEEKAIEAFLNDSQHVFLDDLGNVHSRESAAPIGVKSGQLPEGTTRVESQMFKADVPETVPPAKRVNISVPSSPTGVPDLIDFVMEQGAVKLPKAGERMAEHDDISTETEKFYNGALAHPGGKIAIDEMAQMAFDQGLTKDSSTTAFSEALHQNVLDRPKTRQMQRDVARTEKEQAITEQKQGKAFVKDVLKPDDTREQVDASNLTVGDVMTVGEAEFKVTDIDPDTLAVTLEDGKKYGKQVLEDGQTIFVDSKSSVPQGDQITSLVERFNEGDEKIQTIQDLVDEVEAVASESGDAAAIEAVERFREFQKEDQDLGGRGDWDQAEREFLSEITAREPEVAFGGPRLRSGEKQGDLLSGQTEDLTLVGEKGFDFEAIQKKAEADVAAKEEARVKTDSEQSSFELQGAIAPGTPLGALPPAAVTRPIKSQRQIITDLAKGLNVPIRFGRLMTSKFAGYFLPKADLIGSKRANDLAIVTHEVGHKLDKEFSFSGDKSIRSELNVLGDPTTPGSRSSWTKSKTLKYKYGEGVAEFVRHWLTDPAKAAKDAPATYVAFGKILDANKDVGDVLRQAQDDIRVWRTSEAQARVRSHISVGDNPNKTPYTLSQLTRDLVDDLHILKLASEEAKKSGNLPPSQDPYMMARNLRGSYGMADTFVRDGVVDFNTRSVKLGTSLEDALKPVAGRISDFRDWIVSKRAQELMRQGRETGLLLDDVNTTARRFESDPEFQAAFKAVKIWNANILKYAVDSGLVTPKSATAMLQMNRDYVPFHRVFEVGAGEASSQASMGTGSGLNAGKPGSVKSLHGSTRQIVDPIETMVKNAYAIVTASEKASINNAVADLARRPDMGKWVEQVKAPKEQVKVGIDKIKDQLEDAGADISDLPDDLAVTFYRQSGRAPFGENTIRIIKNGEPQFYRLNKDLFDTFQALDLEDSGKLVRILASPAQLLRSGVVLEPSFAIANALRDTFSAAVIGRHGALPFETTIRGLSAMIGNHELVAEWAASGGKSSVEANYFDRTKLQNFVTEKITKDLTPAEKGLLILKSPLTALRYLTGISEEATRIGEYQIAFNKLRKSGMPEGEARRLAAFEARDRQDFAKGGAKTKIIRHLAAFWNAGLQGNIKLAQTFRERPVRTLMQGFAFITIPKLLEQAVNYDDKDYWDRPQWERDLFFMIPIGKDENDHTRFLRIPTPFEVGVLFGTLPGRIIQYAKQNNSKALTGYFKTLLQQTVPNPIPQSLQMVFEDFLSGKQGWDVYRGRPIVPESLANQPPELQFTEQTSRAAKMAGKALGYSPMKIDHMISQTTGGLGKVLTGQQVPGKRFVTTPLTVSNQSTEDFYSTLDDLRAQKKRHEVDENVAFSEDKLATFESAARDLAELRKELRAKDTAEARKTQIREEMYQKTQQVMSQ